MSQEQRHPESIFSRVDMRYLSRERSWAQLFEPLQTNAQKTVPTETVWDSFCTPKGEWERGRTVIDFIVHREHDTVGVMVRDVTRDQSLTGWNMETDATLRATSREDILLGHKIALCAMTRGEKIIKYNVPIGLATEDILAGQHVHVHNLKTARW